MKIWIVTGDYGSWDGHYRKNLKAFDSEAKAISFKEEYESNPEITLAKDLYNKWLNGGDEDDDGNITPELTEVEKEFMRINHTKINELAEFNECIIYEFDVE
jgi:hypothetical protein